MTFEEGINLMPFEDGIPIPFEDGLMSSLERLSLINISGRFLHGK